MLLFKFRVFVSLFYFFHIHACCRLNRLRFIQAPFFMLATVERKSVLAFVHFSYSENRTLALSDISVAPGYKQLKLHVSKVIKIVRKIYENIFLKCWYFIPALAYLRDKNAWLQLCYNMKRITLNSAFIYDK